MCSPLRKLIPANYLQYRESTQTNYTAWDKQRKTATGRTVTDGHVLFFACEF